jgi:hypothetical protein
MIGKPSFFAELKRRNVLRAAAFHVAMASPAIACPIVA